MMNIFAHTGHDHSEALLQGTDSTLTIIAVICILTAAVILSGLVYDALAKRRQKK